MFLNKHRQLNSSQGFTLIELLVVIVIIGILATLTTVSLTSARGKARDARRISDLKQIASAVELYYADNNSYPTLITAGNALASPDGSKVYMKKVPSDPSTNTSYAYYGSTSRFTLRTTIEKAVDNIPVGPVIVTSGGGVKQALNTDNRFLDADLTFGGTLVRHFALDGVNYANAIVGSGNGTLSGGPVPGIGRYGESNGAISFDGSNDRITASAVVGVSLVLDYSVAIWIKNNSVSSAEKIIWANSHGGSDRNGLGATANSGSILFTTWNGSSYSGKTAVIDNGWHFVVGTNTSAGVRKLYVDSVEKTSSSGSSILGNFASGFALGAHSSGLYNQFNGSMSDLRMYRKVLTPEEVLILYNATRP